MDELPLALNLIPSSTERLIVAFSGGLDSVVLAHNLLSSRHDGSLLLWHVNHGLQSNAGDMQRFALDWASRHGAEIRSSRLNLQHAKGNLEAVAREARYALFEEFMGEDDVLLTAHHASDQAETLLLNLMRGSGPAGLRGIAERRVLGKGLIVRPMLQIYRNDILAYATTHGLRWVDDPSNASDVFDRNYLRHNVLPVLEKRWPSATHSLNRVSQWQREMQQLTEQLARNDMRDAASDRPFSGYPVLDCSVMLKMEPERARNLIRYWIGQAAKQTVGHSRLDQLLDQLRARADATPCIEGPGYSLRIYRSSLYLVEQQEVPDLQAEYRFDASRELTIPGIGFSASRSAVLAKIKITDDGQMLSLRFRGANRSQSPSAHRLKRLFQQHQVPPWKRDHIPQVFVDGELVALWLW
jgi:tRNA(Ile)-lysidine synthase